MTLQYLLTWGKRINKYKFQINLSKGVSKRSSSLLELNQIGSIFDILFELRYLSYWSIQCIAWCRWLRNCFKRVEPSRSTNTWHGGLQPARLVWRRGWRHDGMRWLPGERQRRVSRECISLLIRPANAILLAYYFQPDNHGNIRTKLFCGTPQSKVAYPM